MKKTLSVLFLLMVLSACSNNKEIGLVQVDSDTVKSLMNGEENGFFLAVSDKNEGFEPYVEDVLDEKGVKINYYYTYQPEGAECETVEDQVFDFDNNIDKNRLYYFEDGEVSDPLRLTSYEGTELSAQIENFIKVHQ